MSTGLSTKIWNRAPLRFAPTKRWTKVVLALAVGAVVSAVGAILYLRYFYGKDAPPPFELSSVAVFVPRRQRQRRRSVLGAAAVLSVIVAAPVLASTPAGAANKTPVVGTACTKVGSTVTTGGKALSCRLVAKKKRWIAAPSAATATVTTTSAAVVPITPEPATTPTGTGIEGIYKVGTGSAAGYRVREIFVGGLAKVDAVGRSEAVTGSVVLVRSGKNLQVQSVTAVIDTTKLKSDETRRDDQMRSIGLETNKFPSATFSSLTPVALEASAETGQPVAVTVPGKLTLHGVTRDVQVGIDAQLRSGTMEVVGRISIVMKDYGIDPPEIADFVKADADGMLEFKLVLKKA